MNMASNHLQHDLLPARDACGEKDPSNSTLPAKKLRVTQAMVRTDLHRSISTPVHLAYSSPQRDSKDEMCPSKMKAIFWETSECMQCNIKDSTSPSLVWTRREKRIMLVKLILLQWNIYIQSWSSTQTTSIYEDRSCFWKIERRKVPDEHQCQLSFGWITADTMFIACFF